MIQFESREGGIAVLLDGALFGWIVRSKCGFEFQHTGEVFDAITRKMDELKNNA